MELILFLAFCFPLIIPVNLIKHPANVLLLITDDQDVELGSMEFMPKTLRLLRQRGLEFRNGFATTPICCPSRTTILTGLYAHNHNVMTNNQNCSGPEFRRSFETRTFAVYLKEAGYRTAFFGKYLNEYDGSYVPPGWDEWFGMVKNSRYYNYTVNRNGLHKKHGFDYEKDYFTDLIANESVRFIQKTKLENSKKPFLAVLSFPAPHGPEDPAPQFAEAFPEVETHRTDAWNYAPNPDKQWLLQRTGKMEPIHVVFTDQLHRRRLQTLLSVDDAVHKVFATLRSSNELQNTYILYTSDHGYHLGQFGLIKGKSMPYEFDIKVPFFLRGPGIPIGKISDSVVSNIDIAPTILAMANLEAAMQMDGRSILDLTKLQVRGQQNVPLRKWRDTILVERGKMPKLKRIRDRFLHQKSRYSKERRIARECAKPKYREPCRPGQLWKCALNQIGRWRIHKCRETAKEVCNCVDEKTEQRNEPQRLRRDTDTSFDQGKSVEEVNESEEVLDIWEEEFLREIQQKEVLENGEWYQGVFEQESAASHQQYLGRKKRQQAFDEDESDLVKNEVDVGGLNAFKSACARHNFSFCVRSDSTEFITNRQQWLLRRRTKLDSKIETLRQKLSAFKDIRKTLKLRHSDGSHRKLGSNSSSSTARPCSCNAQIKTMNQSFGAAGQHPLLFVI